MEELLDTGFAAIEQSIVAKQTQINKEAWDALLAARRDFFERGIDPRLSGAVRLEVAESWIRSREMGLDPKSPTIYTPIDDKSFHKLLTKHKRLIEVAGPILGSINSLDLANDYIFELIESSGVSLIQTGNLDLHEFVADQSIFGETTMGTCAHSLSLRHKKAFQIIGPEHYSELLTSLFSVSAPIFDENDQVVATLLLTQPLSDEPWLPELNHIQAHTMGLVLSLASSIEFKLQLRTTQTMLFTAEGMANDAKSATERVNHILDAAIDISKEGLLVIDKAGILQHANPEAIHMLKMPFDNLSGRPIEEVLDIDLMDALRNDSVLRKTLQVVIGNDAYALQTVAVTSDSADDYDGFVLRITRAKKDALGSRRGSVGDSATFSFDDILGTSKAMKDAIKLAKRYAITDENILLIGESGTGKECFVQAIHNYSKPSGPFMSINCAAIPPRLVESELFGYEAGSFTGADKVGRPGKIELADGGTLFLDEIGDMPLDLQATLLRVIENKRVMRLGGKNYRQIDFRVMAATNRDLAAMVEAGSFREDLLYRLSVLSIGLPPLRERSEDKLLFAHFFLNECKRKAGGGPAGFDEATLRIIEAYDWPGNVRQIKNSVTSAYYSATSPLIMPEDLPSHVTTAFCKDMSEQGASPCQDSPFGEGLSLQRIEEQAICMAMKRTGNNIAAAAKLLGISKATLYRKLEKAAAEN